MGRNLMGWWAAGLILGLVLPQLAQAGERSAIAQAKARQEAAVMSFHARSNIHPVMAAAVRSGGPREYSFSAVSPLGAKAIRSQTQVGTGQRPTDAKAVAGQEHGPATAPTGRKTGRLFRLNPRLGDVSVQPVVGGVNGAQLSVGF